MLQFKRRAPGLSAWHILFWWEVMIWKLKLLLFIFYRLKFLGKNNVPKSGPVLIIANHQSNFDPAIVGVLVRDRPFKGIAKEGLFKSKLLSIYISGFGAISIKRGESDTDAIRKAIAELNAGRCVMIFPEGTRSEDGEVGVFQRGFWLIMKKSKATVLPVGIDGAFDVYPSGSKPTLFGRIVVAAGEPMDAEMLLDLGEEKGTAFARTRIVELQQQCKSVLSNRLSKN